MAKITLDHAFYLDRLCSNLNLVGEDSQRIHWTMREGIWRPNQKQQKFPDLIIVYQPDRTVRAHREGYAVALELKTGKDGYAQAVQQLRNGFNFIELVLEKPCPYVKIIRPKNGHFEVQTLTREEIIRES